MSKLVFLFFGISMTVTHGLFFACCNSREALNSLTLVSFSSCKRQKCGARISFSALAALSLASDQERSYNYFNYLKKSQT